MRLASDRSPEPSSNYITIKTIDIIVLMRLNRRRKRSRGRRANRHGPSAPKDAARRPTGDLAMTGYFRRLAGLAALAAFAATAAPAHADDSKVLRIGFQKYGTLVLVKTKGLLEEKLKPLGWSVEWTEFPAGPQLLEA